MFSLNSNSSVSFNATKGFLIGCATLVFTSAAVAQHVGQRYPAERRSITDPASGVTITALTTSPASDSKIYQTHPQWTSDGKYIIFRSNRGAAKTTQAYAYSEETGEIIQLTEGNDVNTGSLNVARKSNKLYFLRDNQLTELNLEKLLQDSQTGKVKKASKYERTIAKLPEGMQESGGFTLDADEEKAYIGLRWKEGEKDRWAIQSINLQSGKLATVIDLPFRVGHMQANPWKTGEILYCHETGGDAPQRMWLVNADGSENHPLYVETPDEWVTHEIWQDRDHVLFNIMAHLPRLRTKPSGIASINVRNNEVKLHDQAPGRGYWHCAGTTDRKWAIGDTFDGELNLINLQTGEVSLLTAGHYRKVEGASGTHSHHTLSPDGKRVLFNSSLLGNSDIMTAPIPENTATGSASAGKTTRAGNISLKYDFGPGKVQNGFQQVLPTTTYTKERGYGIVSKAPVSGVNRKGNNALTEDFITSKDPFYFVVDLPEGNYKVTVYLGDNKGTSTTTVKAESRRLMLKKVETKAGEVEPHTFTVNVRTPRISSSESIKLKTREQNYLNWDEKLTLEFSDTYPAVAAIEITNADEDIITMYLAGNSTVVDQEYEPWAAWGQMIPRFFKPDVVVANYAESGETLKAFVGEKRLKKILSVIKPNDYLFIEFAHNDQKPGANHLEPSTTYKDMLKHFISEARTRGAIPVLVTSMHRRNFNKDGKIVNTLGDYPEAVRQTGKEENVPVIDLNAMSKQFYEAMGPEKSVKAFVHYPAGTFPGQDQELKDNSHFSTYGAYQLAKAVVEGIRKNNLKLADYLRDDVTPYNPAKPDPVEEWDLPLSPDVTAIKPDGN